MLARVLYIGLRALPVGIAVVIVWQHAANINQWSYRPSQPLVAIARGCERLWETVGEWAARISAFAEHLHIDQLAKSAGEIFSPMMRIALSWMRVANGYMSYITTHHYTSAVVAGSCFLVGGLSLLTWYFGRAHITRGAAIISAFVGTMLPAVDEPATYSSILRPIK